MEWLIIIIVIVLVVLITLACLLIYRRVNNYLDVNVRMGLYADVPYSVKCNRIHLNFTNVNKYPEFWEVHESKLRLQAMGTQIDGATFLRSPDIPNGLKVRYPETMDHNTILALTAGVKYNNFAVSYDEGRTFQQINSVKDIVAKKYAVRINKLTQDRFMLSKAEILHNVMSSEKYKLLEDKNAYENLTSGLVSHIDENRSTSESLRFQLLLPEDSEEHTTGILKIEGNVKFYYTYYGKCYEIKAELKESLGSFYEWDLVDLEPGKVYPGITASVDGGKTLFPSTSLFGITKDEDDNIIELDMSTLAVPKEGAKAKTLWSLNKAQDRLGEELLNLSLNIIIKKHYELENEDSFIPFSRLHEIKSDYAWADIDADNVNVVKTPGSSNN